MPRDIDQIIVRLRVEIPGVEIDQLQVAHPGADDDGLWHVKVPGKAGEVQMESTSGACPFLIESDFNEETHHGGTVDEVVSVIRSLFAERGAAPGVGPQSLGAVRRPGRGRHR